MIFISSIITLHDLSLSNIVQYFPHFSNILFGSYPEFIWFLWYYRCIHMFFLSLAQKNLSHLPISLFWLWSSLFLFTRCFFLFYTEGQIKLIGPMRFNFLFNLFVLLFNSRYEKKNLFYLCKSFNFFFKSVLVNVSIYSTSKNHHPPKNKRATKLLHMVKTGANSLIRSWSWSCLIHEPWLKSVHLTTWKFLLWQGIPSEIVGL